MDTKKYTRCVEIIVNEEDYAMLYNFLMKHKDEDPAVAKWIEEKGDPFILTFCKMRLSTEREKANGFGKYVRKL